MNDQYTETNNTAACTLTIASHRVAPSYDAHGTNVREARRTSTRQVLAALRQAELQHWLAIGGDYLHSLHRSN